MSFVAALPFLLARAHPSRLPVTRFGLVTMNYLVTWAMQATR